MLPPTGSATGKQQAWDKAAVEAPQDIYSIPIGVARACESAYNYYHDLIPARITICSMFSNQKC